VGTIAATGYDNTSPLFISTQAGGAVGLAHTRYRTQEAIVLTLSNRSGAPIYLPTLMLPDPGQPRTVVVRGNVLAGSYGALDAECLGIDTQAQSAQGWRDLGEGCNGLQSCPGGAAQAQPVPGVLVVEPGATMLFDVYGGPAQYPPWPAGTYRFSVLYTAQAFTAPARWSSPVTIPHSVTQWTPPVTLTAAWGYPPAYHQTGGPRCPFVE
jgi:hypothetical protein